MANVEPKSNPIAACLAKNKAKQLAVGRRLHTTNTAATTDFDGAVSVFYTLIVVGIVGASGSGVFVGALVP